MSVAEEYLRECGQTARRPTSFRYLMCILKWLKKLLTALERAVP
jgi:hypothetical protein